MGLLDDLIENIDNGTNPEPEADPTPEPNGGEKGNDNGKPADWYSEEFKKFAGIK